MTLILPSLQVALFLLLMWSAGQVTIISTPCLTGKAGFVTALLHAVSRVLQSENEVTVNYKVISIVNELFDFDAGIIISRITGKLQWNTKFRISKPRA